MGANVAGVPEADRSEPDVSLIRSRQAEAGIGALSFGDPVPEESICQGMVGRSAALRNVLEQLEMVACTDATVLISGETGTGKELVAHALHNLSSRRTSPFVKCNCAAIPTGL